MPARQASRCKKTSVFSNTPSTNDFEAVAGGHGSEGHSVQSRIRTKREVGSANCCALLVASLPCRRWATREGCGGSEAAFGLAQGMSLQRSSERAARFSS